jgi:hypothetical protein
MAATWTLVRKADAECPLILIVDSQLVNDTVLEITHPHSCLG